jgi:uncharacterized protein
VARDKFVRELSVYNLAFSVNRGSAWFVFNALRRSGTFVPDYPQLEGRLADDPKFQETDSAADLLAQGIIVESYDAERKELINRVAFSRFAGESFLGLTICPTLKCPLTCPYCYERQPASPHSGFASMSVKTERQVLRFIERHLPTRAGLSVIWYGGEPTLRMKQIQRMSEAMIDLCGSAEKPFLAGMVSSGWKMTEEQVRTLADVCKVKWIQITLEMPPERHLTRRLGPRGESILPTVLKVVRAASSHMLVHLRLNIDPRDAIDDTAESIQRFLRDEGLLDIPNIDLSPCPIDWTLYASAERPFETGPPSTPKAPGQLSQDAFRQLKDSLIQAKTSHEHETLEAQWQKLGSFYRRGSCCASYRDAFVVAPDGSLHKCWGTLGHRGQEVGDIWEGVSLSDSKYSTWMAFDQKELEDCWDCVIFPICLGGCRFYRIKGYPRADYLCLRGLIETVGELAAHYANRKLGFQKVEVELAGELCAKLPAYLTAGVCGS